jgi:quinolinate synthase
MVHEIFSLDKIRKLKLEHPSAKVIAHPECEDHVLKESDFIGSTTALLNFTKQNNENTFIVVTEPGIIHQMQQASPQKTFIPAPPENSCACNECPHMKLNTLDKLYLCLKYEVPEIIIPSTIAKKALIPLKRMLDISASHKL